MVARAARDRAVRPKWSHKEEFPGATKGAIMNNSRLNSDDAFERLVCELEEAGFRLEESLSSSTVVSASGDSKDYVHRTHRIYRGNSQVGEAAILPWARRVDFTAEPTVRNIIEPIISAYKERAFVPRSRAEPKSGPILRGPYDEAEEKADRPRELERFASLLSVVECPACKGHGGWGGLSEPFERCSNCFGTGRIVGQRGSELR